MHHRVAPPALTLLFAPVLSGCAERPEEGFIAVLVGSVLAVLLLGFCGVTLYTGAIAAGAINIRLNLKRPTAKSKRWGWVFGVLNLLHGGLGTWLIVMAIQDPSPDGEASTWLVLIGGTLAAFAIGGAGLWAAAKARPRD